MIEVKKISDREFVVGNSRISLLEGNIVCVAVVGNIDAEMAIALNETTLKLMNMIEGKVHVITDNNRAGKPSSKALRIMQNFIMHDKYGKLAIFGLSPVSRVLANFFICFSKKKNICYMKTKEEAFAWIKGES